MSRWKPNNDGWGGEWDAVYDTGDGLYMVGVSEAAVGDWTIVAKEVPAAYLPAILAIPDMLAALKAGLNPWALNCLFSGQADDPHVCCCGKPKAYHWKAMARDAIAKAENAPGPDSPTIT